MVSLFQNSSLTRKRLNNKLLLLSSLLFFACTSAEKKKIEDTPVNSYTTHSSLLNISKEDNIWIVTVSNPWQNTQDTRIEYRFSEKNIDSSLIKIPVSKIVCFSSSHVAFVSALGMQEKITGVSGLDYICDSVVNDMAVKGKVKEVGYENNIDYEFFIREKPDIALIYGVGTEHARYITRLEELGVKVIYIAEYLENSPLGRLEWIKLFGMLLGEYEKADSFFNAKVKWYEDILDDKPSVNIQPSVFSGSPIGDNWYVPGGNSFMSNLIKDAGGNYVFESDEKNESYPISFELAYKNLLIADIWINCDLPAEVIYSGSGDSRFLSLPSAKSRNIFSNTANTNNKRGNDFWESAVVCPDILLKDIKSLFYPGLYKNYKPVYYRKL